MNGLLVTEWNDSSNHSGGLSNGTNSSDGEVRLPDRDATYRYHIEAMTFS